MVLCGITLVPMLEDLRGADPILLLPFYANKAEFDVFTQCSAAQLKRLMDRGPDLRYFPKPSKSIFITDKPEEKEAATRKFERAVLYIIYVHFSRYLAAFLGTMEELEEWVRPKM